MVVLVMAKYTICDEYNMPITSFIAKSESEAMRIVKRKFIYSKEVEFSRLPSGDLKVEYQGRTWFLDRSN